MIQSAEPLLPALALLEKPKPDAAAKVHVNLDTFSAEIAALQLGYAVSDIVSHGSIDLRVRKMLPVAMLAAWAPHPAIWGFTSGRR